MKKALVTLLLSSRRHQGLRVRITTELCRTTRTEVHGHARPQISSRGDIVDTGRRHRHAAGVDDRSSRHAGLRHHSSPVRRLQLPREEGSGARAPRSCHSIQTQIDQAKANLIRSAGGPRPPEGRRSTTGNQKLTRAQELSTRKLIPTRRDLDTAGSGRLRSAEAQIRSQEAQITQAQASLKPERRQHGAHRHRSADRRSGDFAQ